MKTERELQSLKVIEMNEFENELVRFVSKLIDKGFWMMASHLDNQHLNRICNLFKRQVIHYGEIFLDNLSPKVNLLGCQLISELI